MLKPEPKNLKRPLEENLKLGIIILGYFTDPSPFCKDLSGSCAKAVAMNKFELCRYGYKIASWKQEENALYVILVPICVLARRQSWWWGRQDIALMNHPVWPPIIEGWKFSISEVLWRELRVVILQFLFMKDIFLIPIIKSRGVFVNDVMLNLCYRQQTDYINYHFGSFSSIL